MLLRTFYGQYLLSARLIGLTAYLSYVLQKQIKKVRKACNYNELFL